MHVSSDILTELSFDGREMTGTYLPWTATMTAFTRARQIRVATVTTLGREGIIDKNCDDWALAP